MTCKGTCIKYRAKGKFIGGRYANGQKRCQVCDIYIKWDGLCCPCCNYRLRITPRNVKWRNKLREKQVTIS